MKIQLLNQPMKEKKMITIKEFEDYKNEVLKQGCEPGEQKTALSYEDQMLIGVKFKQLPRKLRNWNKLVRHLPIDCSGDALRKRVEKYMQRNPGLVSPELEGEMYREDYIEQQKVRDWYNAYRRDIREETRIENLKDEIRKAADKFSKIILPEVIEYNPAVLTHKNEAVLLLSDLHIGVDCDNFYNKYNLAIAMERLTKLANRVIDYCERNYIKTLHVLNLGDMIQGLIHTNARIEAQMDVSEQIICAAEIISSFLAKLTYAAPQITYRSVFDNHSRAIASKEDHIEKEQFSRLIDWFIQERLKDSKIIFVENSIDGGIGNLTVCGKKMLFAHGHQDSRNCSMQNFIGLTREWIDYICLAHYHNPATKEFQGCKIFINGSVVGTESYAFGKRLFTEPSQKLLIFTEDSSDVQDIDINLK